MKQKVGMLLSMLFYVLGFIFLFSQNVYGYIDPSVMTYAIQAIAGVFIALGAVVGIYFRKMKKKVNDKLGIDENKNKEIENDEIIIKDEITEIKIDELSMIPKEDYIVSVSKSGYIKKISIKSYNQNKEIDFGIKEGDYLIGL